MTRKEVEKRIEFERLLADEIPNYDLRQTVRAAASLLLRHGKTYSRFQEMACNGPSWEANPNCQMPQSAIDRWYKRLEHRESLLEKRIKAIVAELGPGFGVIFSGDPRGSTIKITVPSGRTNDWGREGICVPTA